TAVGRGDAYARLHAVSLPCARLNSPLSLSCSSSLWVMRTLTVRNVSFLCPLSLGRGRLCADGQQNAGKERQELLQRLEMRGLPRHYMLHPARTAPARDIRLRPELYHKRAVRGQRGFILQGGSCLLSPWATGSRAEDGQDRQYAERRAASS